MADPQKELQKCRDNWVKAARKKDETMMGLWAKMGNYWKRVIAEKINKPVEDLFEKAKEIFEGREA